MIILLFNCIICRIIFVPLCAILCLIKNYVKHKKPVSHNFKYVTFCAIMCRFVPSKNVTFCEFLCRF